MSFVLSGKTYPCLFWFIKEGVYPPEHIGRFISPPKSALDGWEEQGRFIESNPNRIPILMEYSRRLLFDPVYWVYYPASLPKEFDGVLNSPVLFLRYCLEAWEEIDENLINCEMNQEQCNNELLAIQHLNTALANWPPIAKISQIGGRNPKAENKMKETLAQQMLNEFHRALSVCFAIDAEKREMMEIIRESEIRNLQSMQSLKATMHPVKPFIKSLLNGLDGIPLIIKIVGTDKYKCNPKWKETHPKGSWLKAAEECFRRDGVEPKPTWKELAEEIRQKNGNEYQNIQSAMQTW